MGGGSVGARHDRRVVVARPVILGEQPPVNSRERRRVLARELSFPSVERLLDARDGAVFLETQHLSRIGVLFGNCAGIKASYSRTSLIRARWRRTVANCLCSLSRIPITTATEIGPRRNVCASALPPQTTRGHFRRWCCYRTARRA